MNNSVVPYLCMIQLVCLNPIIASLIVWYLTKYGSPIVLRSRLKTKQSKRPARPTLDLSEEVES